jgi:hypothetical protein
VEFAEGDIAAQSKLYGLQGIANRSVILTAEFKEEFAKYYDSQSMLPDYFMNMSQSPNFIMEFPQEIHQHIENYHKALAECIEEIEKKDKFPVEFRERVKSQLTKQ